ncbi:tetratricopeptide repeat protein [Polluticoccus soli]|uniref:tetratricopeptide repeat protein n=1 Tax=Polluticoccus soli TaxID=3034150 RepID=UPI0023E34A52|nr:tetratricopeptide repeat protein [Flavipsychrobacter sp. JY13-12]
MNYNKKLIITGSLACLLMGSQASAQIHSPNLPENKWITIAEEQFIQGHYSNAANSALNYIRQNKISTHTRRLDALDKAQYFVAVADLKLMKEGCVDSAINYINRTADPAFRQRTAYALAQYYFRNNMLTEAIPYYEIAGISNLTNEEIANAKFELAYAYFTMRQFDKAEPLFASIKQLASTYTSAGHYYFGLLAYNQGNFAEALESFEKIKNEKQYKSIVPYYIAEIHYFTGDRQKALQEALQLMKRPEKSYYDNELHLLAGQVLFEDQRYGEALPYFESYYNNVEKIRKEDLYEMAYSYYRVNEWQNAIDKFKPLSSTRDSLGQTAMYLLGDAYLKTSDKKSARNAFSFAADMPFNPGQQQAALLLASKLSYETGHYDKATANINTLLSNFPRSPYTDEAKTLLSSLLLKTSNYEEAYTALQGVTNRDHNYWATLQKVAYGYAIQQIQAGNLSEADRLLSESLQQPKDDRYEAAANFWKSELAYRMQRFGEVTGYAQKYLNATLVRDDVRYLSASATPQNAYLNMGYAAMQLRDFSSAQGYFGRAQQSQDNDASYLLTATLREADAVFMQKDYARALALYDKVIAGNSPEADYAKFQKSKLLGLQGKNAERATLLQSLINATPSSAYAADSRYELALTYIEQNSYQQAVTMLMPLTEALDRREMAPKAWMKIGFAHQQLNETDKAISAYKHVVTEFPSSEERPAALDALKSLYIENNQPNAYATLLEENNISSEGDLSLDSTFYSAAEAQYAAGKYSNAKQSLAQYLQRYPNGIFSAKAHYYKAESHMQLKENKEALAEYDLVLSAAGNDFTENSARKAAALALQNKDYSSAHRYYTVLRGAAASSESKIQAYNGLMLSSYELGKYDKATAYADTLSQQPGLDENMLSTVALYKARSLQRNNKTDEALAAYKKAETSKVGAVAAEARYRISEIYLKQGKLPEAETAANNTIKLSAGNDYWIVKSYILLADVLAQQKDYFNAKATLQSIVKNTKIAELKQEASAKLEQVKTLEKQQSKLSEE